MGSDKIGLFGAQLFAATKAAEVLTMTFTTREAWQAFYDVHHGPLPFAQKAFAGHEHADKLASMFTHVFLLAYEAAGKPTIYARTRPLVQIGGEA